MTTIRIGTRGSKLALWQAQWVKSMLLEHTPDLTVELVIIKTKGDKIIDVPLAKVGGKGLFIKELEEAMLDSRCHLAVHSVKDIPTELPDQLEIIAYSKREMPNDVLVAKEKTTLMDLAQGATVGTSSLRRRAQLLLNRPDLQCADLRGNLDTRLRKLREQHYDAIIVAAAGMVRLGFQSQISHVLPVDTFIPAVGQGVVAIEAPRKDTWLKDLISPLHDYKSEIAVTAERAFLKTLQGGCQVPVAAHATVNETTVHLRAMIADLTGSPVFKAQKNGTIDEAEKLGVSIAQELLDAGGAEVLDQLLDGTSIY